MCCLQAIDKLNFPPPKKNHNITPMNILIAGAGPTGLTAAIELTRRGHSPRIIDRKDAPSPLSRAVGINARSLELLEPSGVSEALIARGIKVQRPQIYEGDSIIGTIHMDRLPHRYNFLLALPQNETEEIMRDALHALGGNVEYGHALTGLRIENGKAHVTINEEKRAQYDLVIGADGARSFVREAMGIAFEGHDYGAHWSIADFESKDWQGDANLFIIPGGHVRFVIRIGERRYRAVADQPEALPGIPVDFTLDKLHRADDFLISVRQAVTYQKECVYLAGDAAHVHSPAGGRGMNLGIDDACDLARRIAESDLAGYTAARHPVGESVLKMSEAMVRMATTRKPLVKVARRVMLAIISTFPFLQIPFLKSVSGLKG